MALKEELKVQGDFLFKYRSYLPLGLLLVGLGLKLYNEISFNYGNEFSVFQLIENSAIFISSLGFLIRVITVGFTPSNTSGRNTLDGQIAGSLNTSGMYSFIRNPLYLGNYFMWLGIAMFTGSLWFVIVFSLVFWIYYERIVFSEEVFLRDKFAVQYLDWSSKTPPFIPIKLNW